MRIEIIEPSLYAANVADEIVAVIEEVLNEKPRCQIALSGGSTPAEIYRALSIPPRSEQVLWDRVDFFLGDERFVPLTDERSNYLMVQQSLLHNLTGSLPLVYPINDRAKSCEDAASDYEHTILENLIEKTSNKKLPVFDLILLGIGEDGHTASLFPNDQKIFTDNKVCIAVDHPSDGTSRVTLSKPAIQAAKRIIYLSKGESKKQIVKTVIEGSDSYETYPARLFADVSDKTAFFIDSKAASLLKPENKNT